MRVLPVVALVGGLACAYSDVLVLDHSVRPQTSPQSVQLIGQEPTQPYVVIAIVSTVGDVESARGRLIKRAASLGGHAVLFDASSLSRFAEGELSSPMLTGKVIVFTDSAAAN